VSAPSCFHCPPAHQQPPSRAEPGRPAGAPRPTPPQHVQRAAPRAQALNSKGGAPAPAARRPRRQPCNRIDLRLPLTHGEERGWEEGGGRVTGWGAQWGSPCPARPAQAVNRPLGALTAPRWPSSPEVHLRGGRAVPPCGGVGGPGAAAASARAPRPAGAQPTTPPPRRAAAPPVPPPKPAQPAPAGNLSLPGGDSDRLGARRAAESTAIGRRARPGLRWRPTSARRAPIAIAPQCASPHAPLARAAPPESPARARPTRGPPAPRPHRPGRPSTAPPDSPGRISDGGGRRSGAAAAGGARRCAHGARAAAIGRRTAPCGPLRPPLPPRGPSAAEWGTTPAINRSGRRARGAAPPPPAPDAARPRRRPTPPARQPPARAPARRRRRPRPRCRRRGRRTASARSTARRGRPPSGPALL
jgi:hypothetical protein